MKAIKSDPVKTVLTIAVGFLVIHVITNLTWLLNTAIIVGLIGVFSTRLTKMIDFLWMKLTFVLSLIVPNILLSLIFYVFLFPIATFSKLFGKKDPLNLKNTKPSLFKTMEKEFEANSFENPW